MEPCTVYCILLCGIMCAWECFDVMHVYAVTDLVRVLRMYGVVPGFVRWLMGLLMSIFATSEVRTVCSYIGN